MCWCLLHWPWQNVSSGVALDSWLKRCELRQFPQFPSVRTLLMADLWEFCILCRLRYCDDFVAGALWVQTKSPALVSVNASAVWKWKCNFQWLGSCHLTKTCGKWWCQDVHPPTHPSIHPYEWLWIWGRSAWISLWALEDVSVTLLGGQDWPFFADSWIQICIYIYIYM